MAFEKELTPNPEEEETKNTPALKDEQIPTPEELAKRGIYQGEHVEAGGTFEVTEKKEEDKEEDTGPVQIPPEFQK